MPRGKRIQAAIKVHIGQLLRKYVDEHRISQSFWAKKMGCEAQTISNYLKRPDISVNSLIQISEILGHDFLSGLIKLPSTPTSQGQDTEQAAELKKQLADMTTQRDLYKGLVETALRK